MEQAKPKTSNQKNSRQHLAKNLQFLIGTNKLSINQLAQQLNIPIMTIRRLLSGQTEDPRIHTLKLFADYFHVSIDSLLTENTQCLPRSLKNSKPYFVPLLDWSTAQKAISSIEFDLKQWPDWQPITLNTNEAISDNAFALQSRPSMYPRFPQGTVFIIDPDITPLDGDIVLVRIKKNDELTLRGLSIDPPEWKLTPTVPGSSSLNYNKQPHEIIGVNVLTLLYNRSTL